jgi:formylglycine-generating enzyme required for sulfatase activity
LGIYNMSGNVYELCSDWYGSYSADAQSNPTGPSTGLSRVLRGGWRSGDANSSRVAFRTYGSSADRDRGMGFRVVLPVE